MLKTKQLIVISGASTAGKTTLIDRMWSGECSEIGKQLGFDGPTSWHYVQGNKLKRVKEQYIERVVLHYDIYSHSLSNGEFRHLAELIGASEHVIVLTLCTSYKLLNHRAIFRILEFLYPRALPSGIKSRGLIRTWKRFRRLLKKRILFRNCSYSLLMYQNWSRFINRFDVANHLLLETARMDISRAKPFEMSDAQRILSGRS